MTQVPASSHGTPFNGGTITQPLVIAPTDPSTIPLAIRASWNAQNADFLQVVNTDTGTRLFAVDVSGNTIAFPHTSEALRTLSADGSSTRGAIGSSAINGDAEAGGPHVGFYGALPVAQRTLHSATATPEQIALALEATGLCGGD